MTDPILEKKFIKTSFGDIAYLEAGAREKPPVLLVHGIPTSGFLWRHVLRFLRDDFHCMAPDLMGLGDTRVDPDTTQFDMNSQAEMLLEFISVLGHEQFSLICHDQGGAAAQVLVTLAPQRVSCLVLTDCVCYDNWPVPVIAFYQKLASIPLLCELLGRAGVFHFIETRTPFSAFRGGLFNRDRIENQVIREYLRPISETRQKRECFKRFLLAGSPRPTLEAVEGLKKFEKPTLVLWGAEDRYISPSWGKKLFEDIPGARRFELIPFCGHFWPEERPAEFASQIHKFLTETENNHAGKTLAADHPDVPLPDPAGQRLADRRDRAAVH